MPGSMKQPSNCLETQLVRSWNLARSASVHQFCRRPSGVELRALIVEAVADLVADDDADAAVVDLQFSLFCSPACQRRLQRSIEAGIGFCVRQAPFANW
jgi:hypothetical protein